MPRPGASGAAGGAGGRDAKARSQCSGSAPRPRAGGARGAGSAASGARDWRRRRRSTGHRCRRPHLRGRRQGTRAANRHWCRDDSRSGGTARRSAARLREMGPRRAAADEQYPADDRAASELRVEHDSARHAVRQGRHHGDGGAAAEISRAGPAGGWRPHGDSHAGQGAGRRSQAVSAVQCIDRFRGRRDHLQEVRERRRCRRHRSWSAGPGDSKCRPEKPHPDSNRAAPARAEGSRPQAHTRRDVRRRDHDLQPRWNRGDLLHADHQLARGRDSGRFARHHRAGVARAAAPGPQGSPNRIEGANGAFEPRQLLPLSLSYDHRVIDGADAMRFLRWVAEAVEQPFLLSLLG